MRTRVKDRIKFSTVDELLGVPESADNSIKIEIDRIVPFANHPFKVLDDSRMDDLVESIRANGVLNPVIVRPLGDGRYEMISGHRRLHASKLLELATIPAISRDLDDDEATVIMVDANIQREELLPSEKAFALKMRHEAIRHQGNRNDLTSCNDCTKSEDRSSDVVGEAFGIKGRMVSNYIRLTYLSEEWLSLVDTKRIGLMIAVDISYFDNEIQGWLYEYFRDNGFLKQEQINALKANPDVENMTQYTMIRFINEALPQKKEKGKVSFSEKKLSKYFSPRVTARERERIIIELLEEWAQKQEDND